MGLQARLCSPHDRLLSSHALLEPCGGRRSFGEWWPASTWPHAEQRGGRKGGKLKDWHPVDLGAVVLNELVDRTGVDPARVEDVVMGCVMQVGEQAINVARNAVMASKLPESVPGTSIDRQCGSSQQARITYALDSSDRCRRTSQPKWAGAQGHGRGRGRLNRVGTRGWHKHKCQ